MNKTTEAKWRALIAAQEKSGLTARAFAEQRGITPTTLYWWRSRLGRRRPAAELVPVQVVAQEVEQGDGERHGFDLRLGEAMVLHVPDAFDEDELRRLLRALRC